MKIIKNNLILNKNFLIIKKKINRKFLAKFRNKRFIIISKKFFKEFINKKIKNLNNFKIFKYILYNAKEYIKAKKFKTRFIHKIKKKIINVLYKKLKLIV